MYKEYIFTKDYFHEEFIIFNKTFKFKKGDLIQIRSNVLSYKKWYFFEGSSMGFDEQGELFNSIILLSEFIELRNIKISRIVEE